LEESVALYREMSKRGYLALALAWLAEATMIADLPAARALYEEALATVRAAADTEGPARALIKDVQNGILTGYAHILIYAGEEARATALLEEAVACCRAQGDRWWLGVALQTLGERALARDEHAAARRLFAEGRAALEAVGMGEAAALRLTYSGVAACRAGDAAAARADLREAIDRNRALGYTFGLALAVEVLAALAQLEGEPTRAARLLGAAAATHGGPPRHGELLLHQLRQETEAGIRAVLGDDRYAAAMAAGRELPLDEILAEALARSPAGPRPTDAAPGGLTPREAEVLRLLAAGATSREIAGALVLSVRTVDRHLGNIYAKIGARNKAEAVAYAVRHGLAAGA
jgi:non-specific serine/threonine protein kinase